MRWRIPIQTAAPGAMPACSLTRSTRTSGGAAAQAPSGKPTKSVAARESEAARAYMERIGVAAIVPQGPRRGRGAGRILEAAAGLSERGQVGGGGRERAEGLTARHRVH